MCYLENQWLFHFRLLFNTSTKENCLLGIQFINCKSKYTNMNNTIENDIN
jgi:hypothetical protein